jgi:ankyrin repeat protein
MISELIVKAARDGKLDVVEYLAKQFDGAFIEIQLAMGEKYSRQNENSILITAMREGNNKMVNYLFEFGNISHGSGWLLKNAIKYGYFDLVKHFVKCGAYDCYGKYDRGDLLYLAVQQGDLECVKYLIPLLKNESYFKVILDSALRRIVADSNRKEVVTYLESLGAKTYIHDSPGSYSCDTTYGSCFY